MLNFSPVLEREIPISTTEDNQHQLESFQSQLKLVQSQGTTVNNGAAKAYQEKKIRELKSKLPPGPLAPPRPVDTTHPSFEKLFRD